MWKDKLEEIVREKKTYGEEINTGVTEEEVQLLLKKLKRELSVDLPNEYIDILKTVNGLEFNGFILYGVDQKLLNNQPNEFVYGLVEYNKIWYENEWQKQYIFLGESNISWYVYDLVECQYYELDNPSGEKCEVFSSLDCLVEKILCDALG